MKLAYLWLFRILFVKEHYKVPVWTKLRLNLQGYLVDQYMSYDFKHCDRREYLSEFDWYRSRRINGDYSFILNNKLVCADMLRPYACVPETYAFKNGQVIFMDNGEPAEEETLLAALRRSGMTIMKPIGFGKGKGVHLIRWEKDGFMMDQEPVTQQELLEFLRKSKDWFLSEYVYQAEYLNKIYDRTANTVRLITLREPENHRFKVFFAVQRLGTSGTFPVDNGSRGGLVSKIDLETGMLSEARSLHNLETHEFHPDSGSPIKGVCIPNWQKICEEVLKLSNKLPYLQFIAWDILITDDGFTVIEANTSSGVNIIQLWGGQRNGELGDFYRFHGIIK